MTVVDGDADDELDLDPEVAKTVGNAFYTAVMSEPETIRARAQNAYTIANATAGVIVTAGVLGGIKDFPLLVQIAGAAAVGCWLVTAAKFIEISRRVTPIPRGSKNQVLTPADFVGKVLGSTVREATQLETKLGAAACWTYRSLGVTAAALGLGLFMSPTAAANPDAQIVLSDVGLKAVGAACPEVTSVVHGTIDLDSLDDDYASIGEVEACGGITLRIPPKQILSVTVLDDEDKKDTPPAGEPEGTDVGDATT